MTISDTIKTVQDFKAAANKSFGNTPFTRRQAEELCQIPAKAGRYFNYGARYRDSHGNELSLGTILSYLDIDHKEPVEGGYRIELYGIRIPKTKYNNLPNEIKKQCEITTYDNSFMRNYYNLNDNKINDKINYIQTRTNEQINRKLEKITILQDEIQNLRDSLVI